MTTKFSAGFKLFSEFYHQKRSQDGKGKLTLATFNRKVREHWKNMAAKQRDRYEKEARERSALTYSNTDVSNYTSRATDRYSLTSGCSLSRPDRPTSRSYSCTEDDCSSITDSYTYSCTATMDDYTLDDPTCCTSFAASDDDTIDMTQPGPSRPHISRTSTKQGAIKRIPKEPKDKKSAVISSNSKSLVRSSEGLTPERKKRLEKVKQFARLMRKKGRMKARKEAMRKIAKKRAVMATTENQLKRLRSRAEASRSKPSPRKPEKSKRNANKESKVSLRRSSWHVTSRKQSKRVKSRVETSYSKPSTRKREKLSKDNSVPVRRSNRVKNRLAQDTQEEPSVHSIEQAVVKDRRLRKGNSSKNTKKIPMNKTTVRRRRDCPVSPIPLTKKAASTIVALTTTEQEDAGIKKPSVILPLHSTPITVSGSETKFNPSIAPPEAEQVPNEVQVEVEKCVSSL